MDDKRGYLIVFGKTYHYRKLFVQKITDILTPTEETVFSIDQVDNDDGMLLFTLTSSEQINQQTIQSIYKILKSLYRYIIFKDLDILEQDADDKSIVCVRTDVWTPGRNDKLDQLLDNISIALAGHGIDFEYSSKSGYTTIIFSSSTKTPVSKNSDLREKIKALINIAYPDSIVWEYPTLPSK